VFEQVLPPGLVTEGNPSKWRYRFLGAKTVGGIYVMKITGKPTRTCAGGSREGQLCSSAVECPSGSCVWYYSLKVKGYGNLDGSVADMQTQIVSGTEKWAVRAIWRQLTHGWQVDKKSTFLDPYP